MSAKDADIPITFSKEELTQIGISLRITISMSLFFGTVWNAKGDINKVFRLYEDGTNRDLDAMMALETKVWEHLHGHKRD